MLLCAMQHSCSRDKKRPQESGKVICFGLTLQPTVPICQKTISQLSAQSSTGKLKLSPIEHDLGSSDLTRLQALAKTSRMLECDLLKSPANGSVCSEEDLWWLRYTHAKASNCDSCCSCQGSLQNCFDADKRLHPCGMDPDQGWTGPSGI